MITKDFFKKIKEESVKFITLYLKYIIHKLIPNININYITKIQYHLLIFFPIKTLNYTILHNLRRLFVYPEFLEYLLNLKNLKNIHYFCL